MDNIKAAIIQFSTDQTSNTNNIIQAVNDMKMVLEEHKDTLEQGFEDTADELEEIQEDIENAQGRNAQLAAVRRLADKIECTEDCFISDDQGAAIISRLQSNDDHIGALINNIRNSARNVPRTAGKKRKRSNDTEKEEMELYADIIDAAVALQNPDFTFSVAMSAQGQSPQSLDEIIKNSPDKIEKFVMDANITIPPTLDPVDFVIRHRRAIDLAVNVTNQMMEMKQAAQDDLIDNKTKLENAMIDLADDVLTVLTSKPFLTKQARQSLNDIPGIKDFLQSGNNGIIKTLDTLTQDKIVPLPNHLNPQNTAWFSQASDV